jgi:regulator of protease activity HflC (stomatin/prohibitin superfamily)
MEKQMRAEREKRQTILIAEGEKELKFLKAEGDAEALILELKRTKKKKYFKLKGKQLQSLRLKKLKHLGLN